MWKRTLEELEAVSKKILEEESLHWYRRATKAEAALTAAREELEVTRGERTGWMRQAGAAKRARVDESERAEKAERERDEARGKLERVREAIRQEARLYADEKGNPGPLATSWGWRSIAEVLHKIANTTD